MTISAKEASKEKVRQLVERYGKTYVETTTRISGSRASDYSEQDTATKFIKPLIEALGWDLLSMKEVREDLLSMKEVGEEMEYRDCVLYNEGKPYIVFEFKPLDFSGLHSLDVKELISKSKALGAKYVVTSRFKETIIYQPETGKEIECFELPEDYVNRFDILWKRLSNPSARVVKSGTGQGLQGCVQCSHVGTLLLSPQLGLSDPWIPR